MSISLSGSTANYLSIASNLGLQSNAAQTICGWFKPANADAVKMAFAMLNSNGYTCIFGGQFRSDATKRIYGSSGSYGSTMGTYSADVWCFMYLRRDTASNSLAGGSAASGLSATTDFADGTYSSTASTTADLYVTFSVGKKGNDGYPWNGEICCIRAWDALLTTDELLDEALSATPVKTANLRANWRLADNSDLTSTVNSYVLTANGTVSTGSTEPTDIGGGSTAKPYIYYAQL